MTTTECEIPSSEEPIRQGDIFSWRDSSSSDLVSKTAVVLTADCDIAWGKSADFYSIAPVVPLKEYISRVWAEKKLQKFRIHHLRKISDLIHAERVRKDASSMKLSQSAVERWVEYDTAEAILGALGVSEGKESTELNKAIAIGKACLASSGDNDTPLNGLANIAAMEANSSPQKELLKLTKAAQGELVRPPHDLFLISDIPGQRDIGYVVLLRLMTTVAIKNLTASTGAWRADRALGLRVGRLKATYKYALTQQLGILFSRIGMPEEYEEAQALAVELVCNGLCNQT